MFLFSFAAQNHRRFKEIGILRLSQVNQEKLHSDFNPQAPVAQKTADEVVFRHFQDERVEFFLIGPHWPSPSDFWCASFGNYPFWRFFVKLVILTFFAKLVIFANWSYFCESVFFAKLAISTIKTYFREPFFCQISHFDVFCQISHFDVFCQISYFCELILFLRICFFFAKLAISTIKTYFW